MKRCQTSFFLFLYLWASQSTLFATNPEPAKLVANAQSANAQFWENKGQIWKLGTETTAHEVKFSFENKGLKIFLLENGLAYQFEKIHYPEGYKHLDKFDKEVGERSRLETYRMDMQLIGANPHPRISRSGESTDFINFYNRNALNVRGYQKITYHEIYPNIDWVVYTDKNGGVKYDFVAHANADISRIKIRFQDHEKAQTNPDGSFTLSNPMGSITEQAPVSFQNGKTVASRFLYKGGILRFLVGDYDKTQDLVIDPTLVWATYYGGSGTEDSYACTVDASGNVYLAGRATSTSNIASGGHQNTFEGNDDAFLVKFNSAGTRLWATYYGGTNSDYAYSCAADANGNVYLAGFTSSTNNIASGGHQNTFGGSNDAFLVKFNTNGVRQWATYYGGVFGDSAGACAIDASGNVYLAGATQSSSNIASGGHQNTYGGGTYDAFLVKFNSNGVRQWATYYGGANAGIGNGDDAANSCAVDANGNVYLAGNTSSANAAVIASGGHQNAYGGSNDAFLVKFNPNGTRLWATYYGAAFKSEYGNSCITDTNGNVYLAGYASASNVITNNGHQNNHGGGTYDAFLVKFNSAGTRLWATYYGGTGEDYSNACAVDASGNVYLAGYTNSTNDIASGGHQNVFGGVQDAFLVKFNSAGTRLWATYYGGSGNDNGYACAVDASANIYLAGYAYSTNAIALGGHQNTHGGNGDAFLVKFNDPCVSSTGSLSQTICAGQSFLFNGINRNTSGAYLDTLIAANGCDSFLTLNLTVLPTRTGSISQSICSNQSFLFNGINRNTSGAYLDTLVASNGCDSFLTLNLTVLPTRTGSVSQTICNNQSFLFNGINRNISGAYLDTLVATNGCDSFLTLNLTVLPTRTGSVSQTICSNQSFLFNGINRNISGAYLDTLVATNGCDSVLTLNLSVTDIDTFISQQGNTLSARQTGATYQWIQCPSTPILGANAASFTPTVTGNYAVSVTLNGCSALSGCSSITVTPTSVETLDNQVNINIYPNPNTGEFSVQHNLDFAYIRVSDLLGRTIHAQISQQENTTIVTIPQAAQGIYIVSILDKNHQQVAQSKILVQP